MKNISNGILNPECFSGTGGVQPVFHFYMFACVFLYFLKGVIYILLEGTYHLHKMKF